MRDDPTAVDAGAIAANQPRGSPVVAGYRLVRVLGQGGMGVVWEAVEHRLDRKVALKVCSGEVTEARVSRLWAEARLAAKIGHPGVVPVHDFGYTVDGKPYYTMDLVQGTEVEALLEEGKVSVPRALDLALQMSEAVAAAHDKGILHRDLKPANMLIDGDGHLRILDFGLAVLDHPSQQDVRVLAGSPPYMAPERFQEKPATAASDVYAIGVILYELLTGESPFRGADVFQVRAAVLTTTPVKPSALCADVYPDLDKLVMRCLARDPKDRFSTARALARAVRALVEGRPLDELVDGSAPKKARRPPSPPRYDRRAAKVYVEVTLDLKSSPAALWPLVANTDRFNKAAGLEPVSFVATPSQGGGSTTTGAFRTMGLNVAWDEHPFEWVKDREHSVYREYAAGPLKALWNRVHLTPLADGGTRLVHEVRAIPAGLVGRVAAQVELQMKLSRRFEEVYRRLDVALGEGAGFTGDPFEAPHTPTADERARVADAVERLVDRNGFAEGLVARLRDLLLYAPDKQLERLRPWALADAWHEDRGDALDVMLVAAELGLLQLSWDLVCPRCQVSHEVLATLGRVTPRGVCVACNAAYDADLASSVELIFRPHPEVRAADTGTYCTGAPARRPHVVAQQALAPGEERTVRLSLPYGTYRVTAPSVRQAREIAANEVGYGAELAVEFATEDAVTTASVTPPVVHSGEVALNLVNATDKEQVVRIEEVAPRGDAVTAVAALAHPRFRELFSGELLTYGQHVAASRASFLFLDAPGRFELFDAHGDAGALGICARVDAAAIDHAAAYGGSVVETHSDLAQTLAFPTSARALAAGIALLRDVEEKALGLTLRAAVHEGPCIALTRDGKVDWFGDTVARGATLLEEVGPGGIALSFRVAEDRDVATVAHEAGYVANVKEGRGSGNWGRRIVVLVGA